MHMYVCTSAWKTASRDGGDEAIKAKPTEKMKNFPLPANKCEECDKNRVYLWAGKLNH